MLQVRLTVYLDREDINQKIPYAMICETRYGARWDTNKRKHTWMKQFTSEERDRAWKMFMTAHKWYFKGVPDEVEMDASTYMLWLRLADYCASL